MKVMVLYGSSREDGNTEMLTERIVEGLECTRFYLRHLNVTPIVDKRHDPSGFTPVPDDHDRIMEAMLSHDVVIFATPLYWYGMSGTMKDFVDRWSQTLRDARFDFRNRARQLEAYVAVVGGADARIKGLPLILQFEHIFNFMSMPFAGYLIGSGGKPGQVMSDERSLLEADWLNRTLRTRATT